MYFCLAVKDLIKLRSAIKNAITKSNSITMVEIAGKKMTVAEAIENKNAIQYKIRLLDDLKNQRQMAIVEMDTHKQKVQAKIDQNIQIMCGKEKQEPSVIQAISETITKGDPVELFDPLKLDGIIEELETEIENFTANVDYVLSESNALTAIQVQI